ncbi:hypothetical protein GCM10009564_20570 [Streptomyces thermogriseus]|uniref:Uncharacterized protein n=1 Tax=Streptomyces thermogriseus TaxID=75292 RepID=A0ABN1SXF0_9ACTN
MTEFKAPPNEYKPSCARAYSRGLDGTALLPPAVLPPVSPPALLPPAKGPGAHGLRPRALLCDGYGSAPARRAAATASPRVWAPSLRMAERR